MITRIVTLAALVLLTSASAATAQEQPRMGGVLKAGMIGEAPTLDQHATTAVITQQITWHMYETLYTYDKNMSPIPMPAEGHAVGDNGRRYTIALRKGVRFHNGKEMTSADVVPSLQHWAKLGTTPKARQLLKEAGYNGQPVRWVTTKEYEWMYNTALMASQRMEDAGFKVDLQVVDWATLVQRRNKPELFDVFSTGFTLNPDPAIATSIQCNWPGSWCLGGMDKLLADLARETDPKRRRAIIEKVQALFYEDVGRIKFGDYFDLWVTRKEVRGFKPGPYLYFWNSWIAK